MKKFNALMIAAFVAVAFTARAEGTAAPETKPATAETKKEETTTMKKDDGMKKEKHAKHTKVKKDGKTTEEHKTESTETK